MDISKSKKEGEATVRKTEKGDYCDLTKTSLVKKGKKRLTHDQLMDIFRKTRLRFTLTPHCNLWCIFCSNEGSTYYEKSAKSYCFADIELITKLSDMIIEKTPLHSIDFSGGEPTIHPDFAEERFKLISWTKKHPDKRFSLHSNGINLNKKIIDQIKDNFSRIGVTINSLNFDVWNKMTNLNGMFSKKVQKKKFQRILKNLDYLSQQDIGHKVFLKTVVMKGINDSEKELKSYLKACNDYGFHPKFLEFEPQFPEQKKYAVRRKELFPKLEKLGVKFEGNVPYHNDPNTYICSSNFRYKDAPLGLHSYLGCGERGACESCYDFLCMFVKPYSEKKGLYIKPCSVLDTKIDLTYAIKTQNKQQLIDLFRLSREYLMLMPGLGKSTWKEKKEFRYE